MLLSDDKCVLQKQALALEYARRNDEQARVGVLEVLEQHVVFTHCVSQGSSVPTGGRSAWAHPDESRPASRINYGISSSLMSAALSGADSSPPSSTTLSNRSRLRFCSSTTFSSMVSSATNR